MEKRTKLFLLILAGLLLLAVGLYFLFSPFLTSREQTASPAAPEAATPLVTAERGAQGRGENAPPVYISPTSTEALAIKGVTFLENKARNIVERVGSGASRDGFLGYSDALTEATATGRSNLLAEQEIMRKEHPASGVLYSISTRAASAKIAEGVFGDEKIVFIVEAIQRINAGTATAAAESKAKSVKVTFQEQAEDQYLVDSLTWSDIEL